MWYLQFHFVCAKLLLSIYMASFVVMRSANLHIFYRRRLYFLLIAVSFPEPRAQRVVFFLQKKRRPSNEPSQTAYDIFALIQFGRSTHRHKLLRKTLILFTPIKKANAKKVAPAKRGKILGLPGRCRCNVHVENNLAFSYGKNCCHCIRQQLLCQPLVGKSAHPVSSVIFYRCRFRTTIVKIAAATATSPAAA